jgi:hypothetical protein
MNIFEIASRRHFRFQSGKGLLTVEDLWSVPLTQGAANLDDIAKQISRNIKAEADESFVKTKTVKSQATKDEEVKLEIVKHIIAVRLQEQEEKDQAAAKREQKAKLDALIERKREGALESMTLEELEALRNNI